MEYLGQEIGKLPEDAIFQVWRTPDEVRSLIKVMDGLPLALGHVEHNQIKENTLGELLSTSEVPCNESGATIALQHTVRLNDAGVATVPHIKQVSLDYVAELVEEDGKIFQKDIKPVFLALVPEGRCGGACQLKDEKMKTKDEAMTVGETVDAAKKLVELLASVPADKVQDVSEMILKTIAIIEGTETEEAPIEEVKDESAEEEKKMQDSARRLADAKLRDEAGIEAVKVYRQALSFVDAAALAGKSANQMKVIALKSAGVDVADGSIDVAFGVLQAMKPATKLADRKPLGATPLDQLFGG